MSTTGKLYELRALLITVTSFADIFLYVFCKKFTFILMRMKKMTIVMLLQFFSHSFPARNVFFESFTCNFYQKKRMWTHMPYHPFLPHHSIHLHTRIDTHPHNNYLYFGSHGIRLFHIWIYLYARFDTPVLNSMKYWYTHPCKIITPIQVDYLLPIETITKRERKEKKRNVCIHTFNSE